MTQPTKHVFSTIKTDGRAETLKATSWLGVLEELHSAFACAGSTTAVASKLFCDGNEVVSSGAAPTAYRWIEDRWSWVRNATATWDAGNAPEWTNGLGQ